MHAAKYQYKRTCCGEDNGACCIVSAASAPQPPQEKVHEKGTTDSPQLLFKWCHHPASVTYPTMTHGPFERSVAMTHCYCPSDIKPHIADLSEEGVHAGPAPGFAVVWVMFGQPEPAGRPRTSDNTRFGPSACYGVASNLKGLCYSHVEGLSKSKLVVLLMG